jgi:sialate O-acetylesterase
MLRVIVTKFVPRRCAVVRAALVVVVAFAGVPSAWGEVRLAGVFGSRMVVPRDVEMPVWGWAAAGERVDVEFAGQKRSTTADTAGAWRVDFAPSPASSSPQELRVTGSQSSRPLVLGELLIGDVWLAGGQSNMATGAGPEGAEADTPLVRFAAVESYYPGRRADDIKAPCRWRDAGRESAPSCSGTALWFARRVQAELNVPVGIVVSAAGGSRAEHWTRRELLERTAGPDAYVKKILAEAEKVRGKPPADKDAGKPPQFIVGSPEWVDARLGGRFNGMIAPLAPFPFRGVLWYQGEDNAGDSESYQALLTSMIGDWRATWKRELPFLLVQLPAYNHQRQSAGTVWAAMREVQAKIAREVPHCGLAVTLDNTDPDQLHPKNKRTAGTRLGDVALRQVYGRTDVAAASEFDSATFANGRARLRFRDGGSAIVSRTGESLTGFQIAGDDRRFVAAEARLVDGEVVVSAATVTQPVAVRYAWVNAPQLSLFNQTGTPVAPFRTDEW